MITVCDECEYTTLIADLILQLDEIQNFQVMIWVNSTELPVKLNSRDNSLHFLQEGIRVDGDNTVRYVWYDTISLIEVTKI